MQASILALRIYTKADSGSILPRMSATGNKDRGSGSKFKSLLAKLSGGHGNRTPKVGYTGHSRRLHNTSADSVLDSRSLRILSLAAAGLVSMAHLMQEDRPTPLP